jgi:CHAT domain-containing protein/tetratricopeptide (TPR) repeat protein
MTAVATHLKGCSACRTVVAETAKFDEEERQLARRPRYRWIAAAAAIGVAALTIPLLRDDRASSSPVASLIEAAPRAHRNVESRVAGFPWARLQAPVRGEAVPDPEDLELAGAAGSVLQETTGDATPTSQHAAGVAYLMIGRATEAVAALERAAKTANDARMWNDVAAAHYHLATTSERASHLPLALTAARRAIELDPRLAEAHFNRALILEALGLRDDARAAWQAYLALDPSSGWSNEAREHLRRLGANDAAFDFRGALEKASRDEHALAQLAKTHPEDARRWGEGPLLKQWADAELAHDADRASTQLALVRTLGNALTDALLRDSVAAIERAAPRTLLARAHLLYDEGRTAQRNRDARAAEPKLREAEALFRRGDSPMAHVAAFHAANAAFEVNGADTAELLALYTRIDRNRHRALAAQIQGQLALLANMQSDWVRAAREAGAGASIFRALGEQANAAHLDGIASCALELLGDRDAAWKQRVAALASVPSSRRGRRDALLHSAALTLAATGNAPAARAVLELVDDRAHDPVVAAESLAQRAELAARSGDANEAQRRLVEARAAAATLRDASVREATGARIDVAEAALYTRNASAQAITLATRALTTSRARGITNLAPDALLQRARAHAAAGNHDAASSDYALALETMEQTRGTIEDANLRLASYDTATQLIEDAVELHLGRGRVADALRVADRVRVVRDGPEWQRPMAAPPRGSVLVEYVVLPQSVVIFALGADGLRVERVHVDRAVLGARVATLAEAIRRRASLDVVRTEASELHRLLIAPLRLDGVEELVLIPDRELFALPFAALYDASRQQYLVERFAIRFAPSAREAGDGGDGSLAPATVVADPPSAKWRPLPRAREEADAIAAMHGADIVAGAAATRVAFIEAAQRSALVHYAGHADTDAGESYGALVLAADANDSGMLASGEIARLRLPLHPLVVLAACGTFRGDPMHAGGMASLARSFLSAGARAVVGTLWEIDDADAAPLFRQFHAHLRAGALPARALRSAQLAMLRSSDPRLRHPATWSVVSCLAINEERKTP